MILIIAVIPLSNSGRSKARYPTNKQNVGAPTATLS